MRDNILGRKEGSVNMRQARRNETRMVEAWERRILEFPLDIDEREVAKQLKREGWYAWASNHDGIVLRIKRVRANAGSCRSGTIDFDLAVSGSFPSTIGKTHPRPMEEKRPLRRQPEDHHFWSLLTLAVMAGGFLLVAWIATKAVLFFLQEAPIP
jgi:hypothetical protein